MVEESAAWSALRAMTDRVREMADDITIIVVANVATSGLDGVEDRSTEYLSDDEANQMLSGLKDSGFRTRFFDGELSFIRAVLADPRLDVTTSRIIVYNIAQSGTDPGRKSLVPAFCALHGLAVCNSNSYAVSLARNKLHVHAVLRRFGIATPDTWAYRADRGWLNAEVPPTGVKLIAKACHESASIGLDASSLGQLSPEYEAMLQRKSKSLGQPMVVQAFVDGREVEAPVVEIAGTPQVLGPAIITLAGDDRLGGRILDYETIARDGYGFVQPGTEHAAAVSQICLAAPMVYEVLGLSGIARVDFRVPENGDVQVTDVSTSPHLVWHSAYAHVFRSAGWDHAHMLSAMVAITAARLSWL